MTDTDPYKILGVGQDAGAAEIKRAYRKLAKQYHPDRNPSDKDAERKFKEVQAAYEVLGDQRRRAEYDQFGAGGPTPDFGSWRVGGRPDSVSFDFSSVGDLSGIFEQFFHRGSARPPHAGRGRSRRPRRKGANLETIIELTFEQAARGTSREVVVRSAEADTERIDVRIPAGIADGQKIRVAGRGQPGPAGRGDLMIVCRVKPHPRFRREGLDLYLDETVAYAEAALGAKIEIPTLDGPTMLTIPAGASGGTKLRLRGRGIADQKSGRCGDMYVVIRIAVPKHLSPRARELIEELADELGTDLKQEVDRSS